MAVTFASAPPRLGRVLILLCVLILARAVMLSHRADEAFLLTDNDNMMRLVQVRDWLAGQGWFDVQQYRVLPPEGIAMHWSRYVDVGIAALLVPLSWVFDMPMAEFLTLLLWPSLMLMAFCAVTGYGTDRLFGPYAAFAAGLTALFWVKIGPGKFAPGSIDHHNVQFLFSAMALVLTILPARDPRRGAAALGAGAGVAAAAALSVGLEMLPLLLLLWGLAALRFAFGVPGGRAWLAGYALSIGLAAPLFLAGQTPMSEWAVPYCDELSTPMLAVLAAGVAASLAGVALGGRLTGALPRFLVMAAVAGVGLWLAAPLAGPCLSGPYGAMPAEAQAIITDRITEAQPAWRLAEKRFERVSAQLLPVLSLVVLAAVLGWRSRATLTPAQRQALLFTLIPAVIGIALSLVQMRALSVAAPVVPVLAGFVAYRVATLLAEGRQRHGAVLGLAAGLLVLVPDVPISAARTAAALAGANPAEASASAKDAWEPLPIGCRSREALDELAGLPSDAVIFSELNFGAMIIAYTPYSATAAGYHRSADAYWNGVIPFQRETAMIAGLHKSGADYLMVCRSGDGSGDYARRLLSGDLPSWLVPMPGKRTAILLLQVDKAKLEAAWQTNTDTPPEEVQN